MANVAELQRTLDYIQNHQDEWNQASWPHCFAGITVRLSDEYKLAADPFYSYAYTPKGYLTSVPGAAMRILGLSFSQAYSLFMLENTFADLKRLVALYSESEPKPRVTAKDHAAV